MDTINYMIQNADALVDIAEAVLVVGALIAALTPTKADDGVVDRARNLLTAIKTLRMIRR